MAAVVVTLVLSVLLAIGVAFAASLSHRMAHSPELRRAVHLKLDETRQKVDARWAKVVDFTEPHRANAIAKLEKAAVRRVRERRPEPAEQSSQG